MDGQGGDWAVAANVLRKNTRSGAMTEGEKGRDRAESSGERAVREDLGLHRETWSEARAAAAERRDAEAKKALREKVVALGQDPDREKPWGWSEVKALEIARGRQATEQAEQTRQRREEQTASNQAAANADAEAAREFDRAAELASRAVVGRPGSRAAQVESHKPPTDRPLLQTRTQRLAEQAAREAETDTSTEGTEQASDQA